jgi:hypothetical protein
MAAPLELELNALLYTCRAQTVKGIFCGERTAPDEKKGPEFFLRPFLTIKAKAPRYPRSSGFSGALRSRCPRS